MPKIRITGNGYGSLANTIVTVEEIDSEGDAHLPQNKHGLAYCFAGDFELVPDDTPVDGYTLTMRVHAGNVQELYEILDTLPESMLSSATVDKN